MRKAITVSAASAALLILSACGHERPTSITSTTGAGILSTDDAVNHLTARRCDREIDCNNVGEGKRYDDKGGCEREVAHDLQAELASLCATGVREAQLNDCLKALREEKCVTPLDTTMSRIATCRPTALCFR